MFYKSREFYVKKETLISISSVLLLALPLAACGEKTDDTVQIKADACDTIVQGITELGQIDQNTSSAEIETKMKEIGEKITAPEIKASWDNIIEKSKVVYKISDSLANVDIEKLNDKEFSEKSDEYTKAMDEFKTAFDKLGKECPALKDEPSDSKTDNSKQS